MAKEFVEQDDGFFPYSVALELTRACNMKCRHCGSSATDKNREGTLRYSEWIKVIEDLNKLNATYITFSGGEPFLYLHWRRLLKDVKSINDSFKVCIISNGSLITESDIVYMKENGLFQLAISLDGDETVHDYLRRFPGAFMRIMDVSKLCQKHNLRMSIVTSFNKYNFDIRKDILDNLVNNGIKNWQVQIVNSFGRAGENRDEMIVSKKQYVQLIEDIYDWKQQYADQIKIMAADSLGYCYGKAKDILDGAEWTGCSAGCYCLGLEANGNVKGCLSLQDDHFIEGNVKNRSIVDIWNDDHAFSYTRRYDASQMTGTCEACKAKHECKAGCLGMAFSLGNTIYENQYCYRRILEKCHD
jgi:radical SAM protein with 4Fe4S-binding SPASM domain